MIDWNKPIQTKDGRKARHLGFLNCNGHEHVVAVGGAAGEYLITVADDIAYCDLMNVPERVLRYYFLGPYFGEEDYEEAKRYQKQRKDNTTMMKAEFDSAGNLISHEVIKP